MKRFVPRKPSPALVVALIALFVALGGTSYAALTLPKNSVGTKQLKNNAVTGAKIATGAITSNKIAGGVVPTVMWAVVNSNGSLARSSGGVSSSAINTGTYDVEFSRNVTACAYSATIGSTGTGTALGQIGEASRSGHPNGVYVETANTSGATTAEPFHVMVVC
jgi:hypothetical protein